MPCPFEIKQVKKYFKERGCELLENKYVNDRTKMKYICTCGKEARISFNSFKSGRRCGCARKTINLLDDKEIEQEVELKGYKFVSSERHRNTYKITALCKKCGNKRRCEIGNFRIGGCGFCSNANRTKKKNSIYDIDSVKEIFSQSGCVLLEDKYENSQMHMDYICSCGSKSKITFNCFLQGTRCKKCGIDKMKASKFDVGKVRGLFEASGCVLLDDYVKSSIPMRYICSCGNKSKISWNNFSKGRRCKKCGISKRSNKNHYEWQEDRQKYEENFRFRQRCYKLVRLSLEATGKSKSKRTAELLGYDHKQLQEHITRHPNYKKLKGEFHIDHIFPIKAFVDYGISDLSIINCLDNLRPLSGAENCGKNAKYDRSSFEDWLRSKGVRLKGKNDRERSIAGEDCRI
jgi:hypothetical protein